MNKAIREDVIGIVRYTAEQSLNNIMSQTGSELAKRYLQRINREPLETLKINDVNEIINIFKTSSDIVFIYVFISLVIFGLLLLLIGFLFGLLVKS